MGGRCSMILVLNNLIEKSYQQNLDLQVAGLRILEARAELGVAIGRQYPQTQEMQALAPNESKQPKFDTHRRAEQFQLSVQLRP